MKHPLFRFSFFLAALMALVLGAPRAFAADENPGDAPAESGGGAPAKQDAAAQQAAVNTQAAAVVATGLEPEIPDFIRDMADSLLELFSIKHTGNSWERYVLAAGVLVLFYLFRRLVMPLVFKGVRRVLKRMSLGLVDKLLTALELPVALFIMITGVYVALRTLQYSSPNLATWIHNGARFLWAVTFLWLIVRIVGAVFDHLQEVAKQRESAASAFMPWIRKTVVAIFFVFGALVIAQQFGLNVQTFLAGLGIGGLAFALAAQDTVANVFGAAVVAVDQPFKIGETVTLAGHTGMVEDIGIRSMKLRRPDKALVVIPNKTVAAESIVNLSKFTNRRVDQVLGFTYDSTPDQLEGIVNDLRALITADPDVLAEAVQVYFRDFSASSLDLIVVYVTREPDYAKHMALRQRLNLAFMRAAQARGLSFAFPTQTIDLAPSAAKALGKQ